MKKQIIPICITILFPLFSFAQDIIVKTNGDIIKAKVLEISQTEIRFKRFENIQGPTIVISTDGVLVINYENGTKESFEQKSAAPGSPKNTKAALVEKEGDLQKARRLMKQNNKVFVENDDRTFRSFAINHIEELKRWEITRNKEEADFVIKLVFSIPSSREYTASCEFIDPNTGEAFYRTAMAKATGGTQTSGRNVTVKRIIQSIKELLNILEG